MNPHWMIASIWLAMFSTAAATRPDVLLIVVDDLRPMLGCYGDTRIMTPNIDALARRSVVFDHAYCQYAKCGTSRLSMMTGLRPDTIGVFSNNAKDVNRFRDQNPNARSFARWLKDAGYHTQSFGKIYHDGWDLATDWSQPSAPGRDGEMLEVVDPADPSRPTVIAERFKCPAIQSPNVEDKHLFAGRVTNLVIETLRTKSPKPRLTAVGYRRPHLPFVAPKHYFDLYDVDSSWLPTNPRPAMNAPLMAWFNSDGYVNGARRVGLTMPQRPNRTEAINWNGYELRSYVGVPNHGKIPIKKQLELLHAYAACVSYVDAQVGKLLSTVDANTITVLCSDHGWHLGEHSAWGKMTNYEIATRIPLLISVPGVTPKRCERMVELVDLYPTLCELTDTPPPEHLQGDSLATLIAEPIRYDTTQRPPTVARSQYSRFGGKFVGRAIRTDRYRYVEWTESKTGKIVNRELYDHKTDPNETDNIAGLRLDLVEKLRSVR